MKAPCCLLFTAALGLLLLAACGEAEPTPTFTPSPEVAALPISTPTPAIVPSLATQSPLQLLTEADKRIDEPYQRRTAFVPLDNPALLTAQEATYLPDDDLVVGLEWQGEARAYPVRMIYFHHIVNDTVAGRPFLITY